MTTTSDVKSRFDVLCDRVKVSLPLPINKMGSPVSGWPRNTIGDVVTSPRDQEEWQRKHSVGMRLTLSYQGRNYSFDYWLGTGHFDRDYTRGSPVYRLKNGCISDGGVLSAGSLVHHLLFDYESSDYDFEEFCGTFGYVTDSRRAMSTYKAVQEQARQMRRLLGEDLPAFLSALEEQDRY